VIYADFLKGLHKLNLLRGILLLLISLPSGTALADAVLEWGGSNYVASGLNLQRLNNDADWRNTDVFKTPACTLQSNRDLLQQNLSNLRAHGQRKVALVLWHSDTDNTGDCKGFLLRSHGGEFSPQVMDNLRVFLQLATRLRFEEVQIRFAPMGKSWPREWKSWDESVFQENWSLIRSTAAALQSIKSPRVVYDLDAELGGLTAPGCVQCPEYVRRMWRVYTAEFGNQNTYGFSIAYAPGRLARLIDDLRASGPLPAYYAIDIYAEPERIGTAIDTLAREATQKGVAAPEFLIQETYYADQGVYQSLVAAARRNHVTFRAIMQWPQTRGSNRKHISVPETPEYLYVPAH